VLGSANDQIWSEQIPGHGSGSINTGGVFGSGNTSPYVFSLSSLEHIGITRRATGSFWLGLGVARVDFWPGLQGHQSLYANVHAMAGIANGHYQSCAAAYEGAVETLNAATAGIKAGLYGGDQLALHEIQDSYASGHGYQAWRKLTGAHVKGDWFPDESVTAAATDASRRYFAAVHGGRPVRAESFLAPKPVGCN
jgi:hypothetical protein